MYRPLVAAAALLAAAAAVTLENCCSLTKAQLEFRNLTTSSDCRESWTHTFRLTEKCEPCPDGMCRVDETCYCPERALISVSLQSACSASFGAAWPGSVGREDIDTRSCRDDAISPLATRVSCCAMSETRLEAMRGTSDSCPTSVSIFSLAEKCENCPSGTCRIGTRCYCPGHFLSSSSRQADCETSFGSSWPASVSRTDRDHRSCEADFTPPPRNTTSCCAMTETELQDLRGKNPECPSNSYDFALTNKCDACLPGTCRVNEECICPDYFLAFSSVQEDCSDSFQTAWPESIGKPDLGRRSCAANARQPAASASSCCSLTESQLTEWIGTSDRCPTSTFTTLSTECSLCPPGMCRLNKWCYCPGHFMSTPSLGDSCEDEFGVAWPASVGKPDPDLLKCPGIVTTPPSTSNPSNPSPGGDGSNATTPPSTSNPSNPSPGGDGSNAEAATPSIADGSNNPTEEPTLTTLEIVGIVAGVVSAVVGVAAAAITLLRRNRRNRSSFEDMLNEDLT